MKNVFKLWFIALAVIIVSPAFAQTEGDFNVDLTEDESGVIITGYTGSQRAVTIPAKIQGYQVKEIGNDAFSLEGWYYLPNWDHVSGRTNAVLTSVTIPAGVVRIGNRAFLGQSNLTSVSIPVSVTYIGNYAFKQCSSLAAVNIPASVISIESSAFEDCKKLATVIFSEGLVLIRRLAFGGCDALKTIKLPNSLTELEDNAFASSGLTAVTLGTGLKGIPGGAFYRNPIITIVIPEGVTQIGVRAFLNCKQLTTVTLPSTLLEIENEAFSGCSALTTVTIPAALESVQFGRNVFEECSKLLLATRAALKKLGWNEN
jgi:hypothetical protein